MKIIWFDWVHPVGGGHRERSSCCRIVSILTFPHTCQSMGYFQHLELISLPHEFQSSKRRCLWFKIQCPSLFRCSPVSFGCSLVKFTVLPSNRDSLHASSIAPHSWTRIIHLNCFLPPPTLFHCFGGDFSCRVTYCERIWTELESIRLWVLCEKYQLEGTVKSIMLNPAAQSQSLSSSYQDWLSNQICFSPKLINIARFSLRSWKLVNIFTRGNQCKHSQSFKWHEA